MTAAANQSSSSVVFYEYINCNDFYGGWRDGKLYGRGTFKYSDGTTYIGEWIGNNTMHGRVRVSTMTGLFTLEDSIITNFMA